uniref:Putative tetratricopeptide repeat protein n=1 Tax=Ornithodoros turicata TaxID=34597 RepID=A0A2R5L7U5_9ACAR
MATANDRAVLEAIFNPLYAELEIVPVDEESEKVENRGDDDDDMEAVRDLETQGVEAAEKGEIEKSVQIFTKAIELAPKRASAFNNRAQALRFKGDVEGAMEDLNNAINLSDGQGLVARQALCQRGLLYRLKERNEEALEDFKKAAKLGSPFAQTQVVQMNPYAALCNQMLGQMFAKIRQGEESF